MKEIILQAKSRLHASARRIRRYLRTPSSFTPGDVTALPMRNDGSLRRRPERMFNIPGAFSQAPEAKLFGVTETTERFDPRTETMTFFRADARTDGSPI